MQEEHALQDWKDSLQSHVLRLISSDHKRVSAEVSLVEALSREGRLTSHPRIDLLATDTFGGKAAALLICRFLEKAFDAKVHTHHIAEFDVGNRSLLNRGIGHFLDQLASILKQGSPHHTCLAPIGGYKVMIAYAYLLGSWMGFPSAYLHEDEQSLFFIPPIPVKMESSLVRSLFPLLQKVGQGISVEDLDASEQRALQDHPHLFEFADEIVAINALTGFLLKEQLGDFGHPSILISPDVHKSIERAPRLRPFIHSQLMTLANKLQEGSNDSDLHHERQYPRCKQGAFFLYKGASNGPDIFRALYGKPEERGPLLVSKIWTNHDLHTREIETHLTAALPDDQALEEWQPLFPQA